MKNDSYFDSYAESYDEDLGRALSVSGEDKNYFARGRMWWLAGWLRKQRLSVAAVLDFGCGTGSATPFIRECLQPDTILGVDVSGDSLKVAGEKFGDGATAFEAIDEPRKDAFGIAICNGVFHHIPPAERQGSLEYVHRSLRQGGVFALFENNPWNPATLYVMSRCRFDRDAITLSPPETRRRMRAAGFQVVATRFLFIFPAFLKALRPAERLLSALPFGTQYVVVGIKR
ncbi:MAG: methyltransferase [Verrucomicrobia bacterium]|nr:methyltransferase [Verrucomicrobiota bacterium]